MEKKTDIKRSKKAVAEKKPKELKDIAKRAIKELERIAFCEEEPIKVRMDILKWFTELDVGKPKAAQDTSGTPDTTFDIKVRIEE